MIEVLLGGAMGAAIVTVLGGGALAWLRYRRLDAAQADDTGASADERRANARVTDLDAWEQMRALRTGLVADLADLQGQVTAMRAENHQLAEQHRAALAHIVAVHEWDAGGRRGSMPSAPVNLALVR